MDFEDAYNEVADIGENIDRQARIDAYRRRIAEFAPGEVGRAQFMAALADDLEQNGDLDEARATYIAALDDGGPTEIDPRGGLLSVAFTSGDDDRANGLLAELLAMARANTLGESDYEWIGEVLEEAGRLREALRWFTIPLRDIDPDDIESLPIVALNGRCRVRRALGLPLDAYDDAREVWGRVQPHLG